MVLLEEYLVWVQELLTYLDDGMILVNGDEETRKNEENITIMLNKQRCLEIGFFPSQLCCNRFSWKMLIYPRGIQGISQLQNLHLHTK